MDTEASSSSSTAVPLTRRPRDKDFYQQRLKAWQPILTPYTVVVTFLLIGIPFIAIGIWLKFANDAVVECRVQYDGDGSDIAAAACQLGTLNSTTCTINITTSRDMKAPIFLYYELNNFYQNHRRYVKSRSDPQLAGTMFTDAGALSDCDPLRDIVTNGTTRVLDPCGLIANSYFNDTFHLTAASSTTLPFVDETGISWASDRRKFVPPPSNAWSMYPNVVFINETYPDVSDISNEHFIVWMRPAALPNFRKLYGRIASDIPASTTLSFSVAANYPVSAFNGKKALVLSTASVVGGKNAFLGYAYIVVGCIAVGLAMVFSVRSYFGGRRLGDTSYLVWTASGRR